MAITPRTRPPLLDQRLPPRRPELQQRILVQPQTPPPAPTGPPFPFWLVPVGVIMATAIFLTTHFLDHNASDEYHPSPWGPMGRSAGEGYLPTMAPTLQMGAHNWPEGKEFDDNETIALDINALNGEFDDMSQLDPMQREYMSQKCIMYGEESAQEARNCKPLSKLAANIDYPNVAIEYVSRSYNNDQDSTTFTYNVCSLDESLSISHVTIPHQGNCCVLRSHYFGSTSVGGLDAMTCTYGLSLDTGFAKEQACKIYTITYMGNVPATSDESRVNVAIGLGRDTFLEQKIVGADCRAPFQLDIPTAGTIPDAGVSPIGGEDGLSGELSVPGDEDGSFSINGTDSTYGTNDDTFGTDGTHDDTYGTDGTDGTDGTTGTDGTNDTIGSDGTDGTNSYNSNYDFQDMLGTNDEQHSDSHSSTSDSSSTSDAARESETVENFSAASPFPWEAPKDTTTTSTVTTPPYKPAIVAPPNLPDYDENETTVVIAAPHVGDGFGHDHAGLVHAGGDWGAAGGRNYETGGGVIYVGGDGDGSPYMGGSYTSAVSVQAQLFALTKTAKYSEATTDCIPRSDIDYRSKSGEDEALKEIYYSNPYKCGGVVVEINAGNGWKDSASYYFEHAMDWKTILIESNPNTFAELQAKRPLATTWNAAFCAQDALTFVGGKADKKGKFYSSNPKSDVANVAIQSGKKAPPSSGKKVDCISDLSDEIISKTQHRHIDIMYVSDVGGEAFAVLNSINFDLLSLSILVLEIEASSSSYYQDMSDLLNQAGYVKAEWDIRRWCPPVFGKCAQNEVWLEKNFNPLPMVGDPDQADSTVTSTTTSTTTSDSEPNTKNRRLQKVLQSTHFYDPVTGQEISSKKGKNLRRKKQI